MAENEAEKRVTFNVEGRVQGVGFRWWTRQLAAGLGLQGTVRNCADGTVEVRVAGEDTAIDRLRRSLLEGPPGAHVTRVRELPPDDRPLPEDFRIAH